MPDQQHMHVPDTIWTFGLVEPPPWFEIGLRPQTSFGGEDYGPLCQRGDLPIVFSTMIQISRQVT